ncbi:MAG: Ig-like domain-containing protein, partial [bacterium]
TTNAGDYQVIISNSAGSTNTATDLVVDCGPLVLPIPNFSVLVGGTATLNPAVYGTPPFSFQWKFKPEGGTDEIVVNDDTNHISGATTAVLVIANAQKAAHAGTYTLGVTNLCSTNEYQFAQVATLAVITNDIQPPSLVISNEDFQAVSTSTVTLSGTASDEGFGDNGIASVKVNGLLANNSTASGSGVANWSLVVTNLSPGTNAIKVVATDNAPRHNSITNVIHIVSDTVQPTLAITAPTAGQRWSNAVFTVNGKATDNRGVTGVWCQTNGVWGSVTTANGWTNWNEAVSLVAGTNTVRAYSQDAAGNLSPTQTVSFVYVLSDRLVVQTNGSGTINPNYNGRTLEIGQTYKMTATAGVGFGFTNWTAGLDGAVVTNKATVRFVMQSNLVLVANFLDVQKPTLVITAPTVGQRVSNTVVPVLVRGRASDNVAVASVQYQLNGELWTPADTTSTWTNWTATIVPPAGTNLVKACAVDAAGNRSPTNWVSFFYVVPRPLTLVTNGVGRITRNFTGNLLEVGRSYTVTAVPGAGQVFSNWVGAVTSSNAKLNFLMQSNMLLQANFVPNPYVALQGTYNGLFYPGGAPGSTNAAATNTGFVKLSLTGDQGLFSGSLLLGGATLPFTGKFNLALQSLVSVARAGRGPLTMNLQLYPVLEDPV